MEKINEKVELWVAVDRNGFPWDLKFGKHYYPENFLFEEAAERHAAMVKEKWNVKLFVKKAELKF